MLVVAKHASILKNLRARGLEIPDRRAAADFLRRVGAHRARTYWHPLLEKHDEGESESARFVSGASFRHAAALCDFDGALSVIAHFIHCVRPAAKWRGRLRRLILDEFPKDAPGLGAAQMGFPGGWENHPFWREAASGGGP